MSRSILTKSNIESNPLKKNARSLQQTQDRFKYISHLMFSIENATGEDKKPVKRSDNRPSANFYTSRATKGEQWQVHSFSNNQYVYINEISNT